MRWFMAGLLAFLLAWATFLASPYWALGELARAVEARDAGQVSARVNFRALRNSMAKQLVTEVGAYTRAGAGAPTGSPIAAAALVAALDPILEGILTPQGVVGLLGAPSGGPSPVRPPFSGASRAFDRLDEALRASRWRGFRNVYFSLPVEAPRDTRFRLQLRLSGLTWRLVAIDLPPDSRRQVAEAALSRQRSPDPAPSAP